MAGTDQRFPVRSANFTLRQNIPQNESNEKNFSLLRDGGEGDGYCSNAIYGNSTIGDGLGNFFRNCTAFCGHFSL